MRIIAMRTLREFGKKHADAEASLRIWAAIVRRASWRSTADVRSTFMRASVIDAETVVFDIHGNDYRLVARIWFPGGQVYVKFVGKHADYDKLEL